MGGYHSSRWYSRNAATKRKVGVADSPHIKEVKSFRNLWELIVVIIGILGTFLGTDILPWWFYYVSVVLVYGGLFAILIEGYQGKWHNHIVIRLTISFAALVVLGLWTWGVVLAKVPLVVESKAGMGDYKDGFDNAGIKWQSGWTEVAVYLNNPSRSDLQNIDLEISVDGLVPGEISQLATVCQGFSYFTESDPIFIGIDNSNVFPSGKSWSKLVRIRCDKLPHESTATLIIPVATGPPKTLPRWSTITGEYRGLGKTRKVKHDFYY